MKVYGTQPKKGPKAGIKSKQDDYWSAMEEGRFYGEAVEDSTGADEVEVIYDELEVIYDELEVIDDERDTTDMDTDEVM